MAMYVSVEDPRLPVSTEDLQVEMLTTENWTYSSLTGGRNGDEGGSGRGTSGEGIQFSESRAL